MLLMKIGLKCDFTIKKKMSQKNLWWSMSMTHPIGHRSTGLPECGLTESSAPEPCLFLILCPLLRLFLFLHRKSGFDVKWNWSERRTLGIWTGALGIYFLNMNKFVGFLLRLWTGALGIFFRIWTGLFIFCLEYELLC